MTTERKLASIQRIISLAPILGADLIEQASVLGWHLVVKKGEFNLGDLCVYCEIDSILPDGAPWAEFMRPRHFRVKTVRFRGVLSQGLALPLAAVALDPETEIGTDVTEQLGITKWEPVIADVRLIAGPFPAGIPKTDELRLQSLMAVPSPDGPISILTEVVNKTLYVSTKLDGMSITYLRPLDGGPVAVCSRNWLLHRTDDNQATRLCVQHRLDELLPPGYALQGELCGPGIQKNRLGLSQPAFYVFNIVNMDAGFFLDLNGMRFFLDDLNVKGAGLQTVPVEEELICPDWTLDQWLARAEGFYAGTKFRKEGIVVRPVVETRSRVIGGRLSFKVISNSFLLKDEA